MLIQYFTVPLNRFASFARDPHILVRAFEIMIADETTAQQGRSQIHTSNTQQDSYSRQLLLSLPAPTRTSFWDASALGKISSTETRWYRST